MHRDISSSLFILSITFSNRVKQDTKSDWAIDLAVRGSNPGRG